MEKKISMAASLFGCYFVCKRQLWFNFRNIEMQHFSELIKLGNLIHEISFEKEKKEVEIDGIKFDFIKKKNKIFIEEIKKSDKMYRAHYWQVIFYLYILKTKYGIDARAILHYPKQKRKKVIKLFPEKEQKIKEILKDIREITARPKPPEAVRKPYCKSCSYYELCFA